MSALSVRRKRPIQDVSQKVTSVGFLDLPADVVRHNLTKHMDGLSMYLCAMVCKSLRRLVNIQNPARRAIGWPSGWDAAYVHNLIEYPLGTAFELFSTLLRRGKVSGREILEYAVVADRLDLIQWALDFQARVPACADRFPSRDETLKVVLEGGLETARIDGKFQVLQYAVESLGQFPCITTMCEIIRQGDLELLVWLFRYKSRVDAYGSHAIRNLYNTALAMRSLDAADFLYQFPEARIASM